MSKEQSSIVGEIVEVTSGIFASLQGEVTSIDQKKKIVRVELEVLGRKIQAELSFHEVIYQEQKLNEYLRSIRPDYNPEDLIPPPEHPGLMRSMLEKPHDDAIRLIYADWLEEQGAPHADYLRLQVSLGKAVRNREPIDELIKQEQAFRERFDPEWINRVRRLTTRPPSVDVGELLPELASHERTTFRMHPRQGTVPELDASKLGGLFLWPKEEPWPVWKDFQYTDWFRERLPHISYAWEECGGAPPEGADIPLVPVVQLNKRDFPILEFPDDADLLQLFWLPIEDSEDGPRPLIYWRNSQTVKHAHETPPELTYYESGLVPEPCRFHAEPVVEYPLKSMCDQYECDPDHAKRIRKLVSILNRPEEEVHKEYVRSWSAFQGNKVGGYPVVNQGDAPIDSEDQTWEFLLSLSNYELNGSYPRRIPIEDTDFPDVGHFDFWKLTGNLNAFGRGDYFVLISKRSTPWQVRAFTDWT